ncbi:MAG: bacillithiol biosynthesis BshC, partial [Bacteroidota bacterium]
MSTATFQIKPDYLNSAEELKPFHHYPLRHLDFGQIIHDKKNSRLDRNTLVGVLKDQYQGIEVNDLVKNNLESLREENTFTVTTGHQLVLFGGPLFTVYKIMSTIRLTEKLKLEHPQHHFVPVFWIHTEDHDYEEINHYYLDFGEKRTYPGQFQTKVGAHLLEERIRDFAPQNFAPDLVQAYQPGQSLAQATRLFFHTLFQEYGLVILDADDARLKQVFAQVMLQEVESQPTQSAVNSTSRALELAGYTTQI